MAKKKTKRQEKSGLIEIKKTVTFPDGTKKRKSFYGKSKLAANMMTSLQDYTQRKPRNPAVSRLRLWQKNGSKRTSAMQSAM